MNAAPNRRLLPRTVFLRGPSARAVAVRRAPIVCAWLTAFAVLCLTGGVARAYTPSSPDVLALVQDGLAYLEKSPPHEQVGGEALIGMTLSMNGYAANHPRVAKALSAVLKEPTAAHSNYSLGLTVIFLCDVDPKKYAKNIQALLAEFYKRQQKFGVWTYGVGDNGDVSQTQYAMLALWTAYRNGFDEKTIEQRVVPACNWLVRAQDPRGGWGYQNVDPGGYTRRQQDEITLSTTAAALGSLYICGDILGLSAVPADKLLLPSDLPALVPVVAPREAVVARTNAVDKSFYSRAQIEGNRWMQANYKISLERWPYYYLYALERYNSFREIAENRRDDSPRWYNDGVEFLKKKQLKNGTYDCSGVQSVREQLATCFAVLFLIRSTKKKIGMLTEGTLRGGVKLPSNDAKMALHGGRIVAADVSKSMSELLSLLEDQESSALNDLIDFSTDIEIVVDDPEAYQDQLKKLRELAGHKSYEVRRVAVRALAKTRDLDNVPALIYALSDPDPRVAKEAEDGLRFVSRKLEGFDSVAGVAPLQRTTAIYKWKEWYQSIRPDAVFSD